MIRLTKKQQPRLTVVNVDVQEATAVSFDSHPKKDGTRKTEYGSYLSINKSHGGC